MNRGTCVACLRAWPRKEHLPSRLSHRYSLRLVFWRHHFRFYKRFYIFIPFRWVYQYYFQILCSIRICLYSNISGR